MVMKRETAVAEQRERGGTTAAKMNWEAAEKRASQFMEELAKLLQTEIVRLKADGFLHAEIAQESTLDVCTLSKVYTGVSQWYNSLDSLLIAAGCLGVDHPPLDATATKVIGEELYHGDRSNIHVMTAERRRLVVETRLQKFREALVLEVRAHVQQDGRTPALLNADLELPADLLGRVCRQRVPPQGVVVKTERLLALCYLLKRPLGNIRIKVV